MLVQVPAAPFLIQLLVSGLKKQQMMAQVLGLLHLCGRPKEAPGTWLWIGPVPAIAVIWEVNQQIEDLFLFLSQSVCVCVYV